MPVTFAVTAGEGTPACVPARGVVTDINRIRSGIAG
jgi:hypothetical protein